MAQNEETLEPPHKSAHSHLPYVNCPDTPISTFNLLPPYHTNKRNQAAVSAAAALFLQAASVDNGNRRKSINYSLLKQQSSSPDRDNSVANAAAAAASLMSHSPTANSHIQAALALAMAAASPPSTCPSSSSSGHHHPEHHTSSENFRSENRTSSPLFHPPSCYESVDGGADGNDVVFPTTTLHSGNIPNFSQFTGNATSPVSARLTNAMLLPASIVNAIGHQMQAGHYHPDAPQAAYLSAIGNNNNNNNNNNSSNHLNSSNNNNSNQFVGDQPSASGYAVNISTTSPSNTDPGRFSSTSRASSATLHDENSNKREQRLLKNREAARECRRKKKEYVRCLERQVAILQNQNQQLIDELQKMKALCSNDQSLNLIIDGANSSSTATPRVNTKERGLIDGMDFIDSAAPHAFRHAEEQLQLSRHRLAASSSSSLYCSPAGGVDTSYKTELDLSSQRRNQLTNSRNSNIDQQRIFLESVASAALKNRHLDKESSGEYSTSNWFSPKSVDRPSNLSSDRVRSPHVLPVKRALKEFEHKQEQQHRLAEQSLVEKMEPNAD